LWLLAIAGFAIGLPVIVVIAIQRGGNLWPYVPIVLGGWVIAMLFVRAVVVYKINMSAYRKQREIARQDIGRLEARIDDAQRKSGEVLSQSG